MAGPSAERLAAVRAAAAQIVPRVLDVTARVAAVPAPTGDEAARSGLVADLFAEAGFAAEVDALGDVVATLPGATGGGVGPAVLLAGHLDTVFAADTPLPIRHEADRLHGPGIGDNSLGVAAVLMLPALLAAAGQTPAVDLILVANVGEEGLGNLRGMRAVMDHYPDVGAALAIEDLFLEPTHAANAIRNKTDQEDQKSDKQRADTQGERLEVVALPSEIATTKEDICRAQQQEYSENNPGHGNVGKGLEGLIRGIGAYDRACLSFNEMPATAGKAGRARRWVRADRHVGDGEASLSGLNQTLDSI